LAFRSHGIPDELSSGPKLLPAAPDEGVWISDDVPPQAGGRSEDAVLAGEGFEGKRTAVAEIAKEARDPKAEMRRELAGAAGGAAR